MNQREFIVYTANLAESADIGVEKLREFVQRLLHEVEGRSDSTWDNPVANEVAHEITWFISR